MLALTAATALLWSNAKLFWQDEMYEFQTDSVASLRELVHVQRTSPISLDPLLYHALSHGAMRVFGANAFAQRLPALAGFLLMQVCLFFLVRHLAGERAAAVAATFPALTATLYYAAEGRPYGLLLGLYALAALCWVCAADGTGASRPLSLAGLALAVAATLNTHYFGVLLLIPIGAAELWRTLARRRLDWPMLAAIAVGASTIVFTRSLMRAAAAFRVHYYNQGRVGLHDITRAYRSIFLNYTGMPLIFQRTSAVALAVLAIALIWESCRIWRCRTPRVDGSIWVLLTVLAALPFAGYLVARFVTHSIEVRYVLGALVAISALVAMALARWLESDLIFSAIMLGMGLLLVVAGAARIHTEKARTRIQLATLALPNAANRFLHDHPDRQLYMQDMGAFEEDRYYVPDSYIQARITLIYSAEEELRWNGHDTMALTAANLSRFSSLPVEPYEHVRTNQGEQLFLLRHSGWDWTDQALAADGAQVQIIGQAFSGDLALVRFP